MALSQNIQNKHLKINDNRPPNTESKTILGHLIIPTFSWVFRKHESEGIKITILNVFGCVNRASNSRRLGPSISSNDEAKIELCGQCNNVDVCRPMSIPTSFERSTHGTLQRQGRSARTHSFAPRHGAVALLRRPSLLLRGHHLRLSRIAKGEPRSSAVMDQSSSATAVDKKKQ